MGSSKNHYLEVSTNNEPKTQRNRREARHPNLHRNLGRSSQWGRNHNKGDTNVFVSATAATTLRPGQDFFPLTVDYLKNSPPPAVFPGGYFKREGKPSEKEILTSASAIVPCVSLSQGFLNEVQVIGYLLSTDQINEADVLWSMEPPRP